MTYLCDNKLAPLTFSCGFIEKPLDDVVKSFRSWQRLTMRNTKVNQLSGELSQILIYLEPLDTEGRTTLFCETKSKWTALFDNSISGANPEMVVSYLSKSLRVPGCVFVAIPNTITKSKIARGGVWGCHAFRMYSPNSREQLGLVRSITLQNDVDGWSFNAIGEPFEFEDESNYNHGKSVDRFSIEHLKKIGDGLGLRPFSQDFYGPKACSVFLDYFFRRKGSGISIAEARNNLGIEQS